MGTQWLSETKTALQTAGFRVQAGYPARFAPALTEAVAAVNPETMEGGCLQGIQVLVISPRGMGLEYGQSRAIQALQAVAADGNRWRFSGWRYEAGIDCWVVELHGVYRGGGYTVHVGQQAQPGVTDFQAERQLGRRLIYPHWAGEPSGAIPGRGGWTFKLTQMLPQNAQEPELGDTAFTLTVQRGTVSQVYQNCYWQFCQVQQLPEGTRVLRKGFALSREVSTSGEDAV